MLKNDQEIVQRTKIFINKEACIKRVCVYIRFVNVKMKNI